jgi:hypothetical protein
MQIRDPQFVYALSDLVRENLSEVEAYPVVSGSIDRLLKRAQS